MAITVKQALTIGGLQRGRLLAGEQQLDNVINSLAETGCAALVFQTG